MAVQASWPRLVRALTGLARSRERAEDALQDAVEDALKPGVVDFLTRVLALLLSAIAVQLVVDAVRSLIVG